MLKPLKEFEHITKTAELFGTLRNNLIGKSDISRG